MSLNVAEKLGGYMGVEWNGDLIRRVRSVNGLRCKDARGTMLGRVWKGEGGKWYMMNENVGELEVEWDLLMMSTTGCPSWPTQHSALVGLSVPTVTMCPLLSHPTLCLQPPPSDHFP